jgi:hypothetical protein
MSFGILQKMMCRKSPNIPGSHCFGLGLFWLDFESIETFKRLELWLIMVLARNGIRVFS